MKRAIGWTIGVIYLGIISQTVATALDGFAAGHSDVGFWWMVVSGFMAIAATGAFVGTWIHTRPDPR